MIKIPNIKGHYGGYLSRYYIESMIKPFWANRGPCNNGLFIQLPA